MSDAFELRLRPCPGGMALDLIGPLGRAEGERVVRAVQEAGTVPQKLVLNFTQAGPINTAGLGGVLWAVRQVTKAGGQASAYGLSEHMRKVCHVMGLTQFIRILLDEEEAYE